jgi:hypothetical protein
MPIRKKVVSEKRIMEERLQDGVQSAGLSEVEQSPPPFT